MVLLLLSFILILLASIGFTLLFDLKDIKLFIIFSFLAFFSNIVLTFEFLSLFSAINSRNVLLLNFLFLIFSLLLLKFRKSKIVFPEFDLKSFYNRFINALKLDKILAVLVVSVIVMLFGVCFLDAILPITNADAADYHVLRSIFWLINGNVNHFPIADVRALCLPINSELLYAWMILFTKKIVFIGFVSLAGYLIAIISIWGLMSGYCVRKRLWTIGILSSLASVIIQLSGTETDVFVSGLVLASMFIYKSALMQDEKSINPKLFMASLAYALAVGTKTPAIMAIPAIAVFFLFYGNRYRSSNNLKYFGVFCLFSILNFVLVASYNYILNIISFENILGPENFIHVNKNFYGIKGTISTFIKNCFVFFDFAGFKISSKIYNLINALQNNIISFFHSSGVPNGLYNPTASTGHKVLLLEPTTGTGVIGCIVGIPSLICAFCVPLFEFIVSGKVKFKRKELWVYSFIFLFCMIVLAYNIIFTHYAVRYMTFFIMLSAPVFVYSYFKNRFIKCFIVLVALFYTLVLSSFIPARSLGHILNSMINFKNNVTCVRLKVLMYQYRNIPTNVVQVMYDYYSTISGVIKGYGKEAKILMLFSTSSNLSPYAMMKLNGYNIDFDLLETVSPQKIREYDVVILNKEIIRATNIRRYDNYKYYTRYLNSEYAPAISRKGNIYCRYKGFDGNFIKKGKPFESYCHLNERFMINSGFERDEDIYLNNKFPNQLALSYVIFKKIKKS